MIRMFAFLLFAFSQFQALAQPPYSVIEWQEVQTLLADDGMAGDFFGFDIEIHNNLLAIGASSAQPNGNFEEGAVYLFNRQSANDDQWSFLQKITRTDLGQGPRLGLAIEISDDFLFISAPHFRADGPGSCNTGVSDGPGRVFVYQQDSMTGLWNEFLTITPDDSQNCDEFGSDLQLIHDTLYVGSRFAPGASAFSGGVYVFQRNEGGPDSWGQVFKVIGPSGQTEFGVAVAVHNNDMIIGQRRFNNSAGNAQLYARSSPNSQDWTFSQNLVGANVSIGDEYGITVAIDGDWIVVGSGIDDIGVANQSGSADVFHRNLGGPNNWGRLQNLNQNPPITSGLFGNPIQFNNNRLYIGARGTETGPTGMVLEFIFDETAGLWVETNEFIGSDTASSDTFGGGFGVDQGTLVIGATLDDNNGADSGTAYSFRFESNLQIIVDADDIQFTGGDNVIYTVLVQNDGTTPVTGVRSELALDDGLSVVTVSNCAEFIAPETCLIGELPPGGFAFYEVTAQIGFLEAGFKTAIGTVSSDAIDSDLSNNIETEIIEVLLNEDFIFIDGFENT